MPQSTDHEAAFDSVVERAARKVVGEAQAAVTSHPEPEELIAYQEGRMPASDAERLRRHLVACLRCAQEVLELEDFVLDPPVDPGLLPRMEETAKDWGTFQRWIAEERPGAAAAGIPRGGGRSLGLLAAALAIALTGLVFWIAGLERSIGPQIAEAMASRHPFVFDLMPDDEDLRRDVLGAREVNVPMGMDLLVPRLNLGDQTPHDAYRVELQDSADHEVWSQTELQRQPAGEVAVLVEKAEIDAGRYRLRLVGVTGGEETVLAVYSFDLRYLEK